MPQSLAEEAAMLEQQLNKKLAQSEKVKAELAKLAELETPENKDDLQVRALLLESAFFAPPPQFAHCSNCCACSF